MFTLGTSAGATAQQIAPTPGVAVVVGADPVKSTETVSIAGGTLVDFEFVESVSSKTAKVGQRFAIRLVEPILAGSATVGPVVQKNGTKLSSLTPGKYVVIAADPGIHRHLVKSEATDTLRMEIEAGETYYAQCTIGTGVVAGRPNLSSTDAAVFGKMKLKLVAPTN